MVKERPLQTASVTTEVAISRRVFLFKLFRRGRQEARRSRGGGVKGRQIQTDDVGVEPGRGLVFQEYKLEEYVMRMKGQQQQVK